MSKKNNTKATNPTIETPAVEVMDRKVYTVSFVKAKDIDPNAIVKVFTVTAGDKSFSHPQKPVCREWLKEQKLANMDKGKAANKAASLLAALGIAVPKELQNYSA